MGVSASTMSASREGVCIQGVGSASREGGLHLWRGVYIQGVCIQGGLHLGVVCIMGVSASREGGLHPEGGLYPGGSVSGGGVCIQGVGQTPPHRILRDTVNEQAIRILLECILV